jgi:hypothetical protein
MGSQIWQFYNNTRVFSPFCLNAEFFSSYQSKPLHAHMIALPVFQSFVPHSTKQDRYPDMVCS